jgi:hypothetical protein
MSTTRIVVLLLAVAVAAAWSTACTATSCTRDPDSLVVGLKPVDGGAEASADSGEAGADGGEASADGGAEAGADSGAEPRPDIETGFIDENTYYSARYGGPYAHYPPFRTITFEHYLNAIPAVQFWLAFSESGTLGQSAGNITELRTDDNGGSHALTLNHISVYNNTCSDFYLWVMAERPSR